MEANVQTELILRKLVFDKISFERLGFKADTPLTYSLQTQIGLIQPENLYRVSVTIQGEKKQEYTFEISITGFIQEKNKSEAADMDKIAKAAIRVLLPYLKNQLAVLTAQPETDCVVLPPIDVEHLLSKKNS